MKKDMAIIKKYNRYLLPAIALPIVTILQIHLHTLPGMEYFPAEATHLI